MFNKFLGNFCNYVYFKTVFNYLNYFNNSLKAKRFLGKSSNFSIKYTISKSDKPLNLIK